MLALVILSTIDAWEEKWFFYVAPQRSCLRHVQRFLFKQNTAEQYLSLKFFSSNPQQSQILRLVRCNNFPLHNRFLQKTYDDTEYNENAVCTGVNKLVLLDMEATESSYHDRHDGWQNQTHNIRNDVFLR